MKTAVLLSGGLDSIALSYWKRPQVAFTVKYGQLASDGEIRASRAACKAMGIVHEVLNADVRSLGAGDLAGSPSLGCSPVSEWWPYRNQFLVTVAGMRALSLDVCELLVGSVKSDGVHVDGSESFYSKLDDLMSIQEGQLKVSAPALSMTSAELITRSGISTGILSWAHSCHVGSLACGRCRGCLKHFSVLQELGYDPY
jgi:7-cyano-7-deazaguanine synthase